MTFRNFIFTAVLFGATTFATAQNLVRVSTLTAYEPSLELPVTASLPRMAPELALSTFQKRSAQQALELAASQDHTTITAELPDTAQKGEYELVRTYTAEPRSLSYSTVKFTGDGFVKTTVIAKLLQSEVEHIQKGDGDATAITEANYKFSYKGSETIDGRVNHIFQIKPRRKQTGLIKGKIYLDAYTGHIRRMEGSAAKSPSFFVKSLEFVQDFGDISGFTVPTVLKSTAKARIIGRALVSVVHNDYELKPAATSGNAVISAQTAP